MKLITVKSTSTSYKIEAVGNLENSTKILGVITYYNN